MARTFLDGRNVDFPINYARHIMLVIVLVVIYSILNRDVVHPHQDQSDKQYNNGKKSETALEILKKRYATGEITKEEFEQMKKTLNS